MSGVDGAPEFAGAAGTPGPCTMVGPEELDAVNDPSKDDGISSRDAVGGSPIAACKRFTAGNPSTGVASI